jgi:hypothetical protein
MKNRKREICTSGTVRDEDGNILIYSARPHEGGAARTGAGVRKPPREETAGGVARRRVRRYGDCCAGGVLPRSIEGLVGRRLKG